jgi:hypothetical protein
VVQGGGNVFRDLAHDNADVRLLRATLALLDTVVLKRDLPEHGLRATKALVTLKAADVRSVGGSDMLTVRTA